MKLKVYTADGLVSEEREFDIPLLKSGDGVSALKQVLLAHRANKRQGTSSAKTRSEVSGTGRKPYRQKGTGAARHGSRRSPIFTGGGVTFGPKPRSYSQKINRKVRRLAFQRALFDRASDGEMDVIERLEISEPKTRLFGAVIKQIAPNGSVLVIDEKFDDSVILASRNINRVSVMESSTVNAFLLSLHDRVVVSEKGIANLLKRAEDEEES